MGEEKKFKWLLDTCYSRQGRKLIKDQSYDVKDFQPGVIAEWHRQKAIKFIKESKDKKD